MRLPILKDDPEVCEVRQRAERQIEALDVSISCEAGCTACCRHLVPLAPAEWRRLGELLDRLDAADSAGVAKRWDRLWEQLEAAGISELLLELADDPHAVPHDGRLWLASAYRRAGVDCPFLVEGLCTIYDERPLACRLHLSTRPPAECRADGGGGDIRLPGPPPVAEWAARSGGHWKPLVALRRPMMANIG